MLSENFIWLAIAIASIGSAFYLWDTLRGTTQPNRVTMLLWGVAPLVGYFSQRKEGAGIQIAFTLMASILPLIILAASFMNKKAYWALTTFDLICGTLSIIALVFLVLTGNGLIALILSIIADFFASLPTIIKSYKFPKSETAIAYVLEVVGSIIVLFTIKDWRFVNYAFVIYVLLDCTVITALLLYPRKKAV